MKLYTTLSDLEGQEVIPALGEFVDDFDTEAIAFEISEYQSSNDLNKCGFIVTVTEEEFWEIVEKHDRSITQ
ncbi:hypothetical protein [Actinotignum urinale]|uniref:hypothetical protein n=1 Tax=Actinotignum urinale TaxID=190146 RepID=UPI0003B60B07|nr:hypothetical protein [Actinotignum urinale]MDY5160979.1 hypothetical protein [Actinotignum urinale]